MASRHFLAESNGSEAATGCGARRGRRNPGLPKTTIQRFECISAATRRRRETLSDRQPIYRATSVRRSETDIGWESRQRPKMTLIGRSGRAT
jgi:hypothetical protein